MLEAILRKLYISNNVDRQLFKQLNFYKKKKSLPNQHFVILTQLFHHGLFLSKCKVNSLFLTFLINNYKF